MTNFTPGPWKLWTSNSYKRFMSEGRNSTPVCVPIIAASDGHPDLHVSEADANLIKTAPDLFESLKGLVRIVEAFSYTTTLHKSQQERLEKAKAALAKATGESE